MGHQIEIHVQTLPLQITEVAAQWQSTCFHAENSSSALLQIINNKSQFSIQPIKLQSIELPLCTQINMPRSSIRDINIGKEIYSLNNSC